MKKGNKNSWPSLRLYSWIVAFSSFTILLPFHMSLSQSIMVFSVKAWTRLYSVVLFLESPLSWTKLNLMRMSHWWRLVLTSVSPSWSLRLNAKPRTFDLFYFPAITFSNSDVVGPALLCILLLLMSVSVQFIDLLLFINLCIYVFFVLQR